MPASSAAAQKLGNGARLDAVAFVGGVGEGEVLAEQLRQHRGGGTRLRAVAARIFREWRRDQQGLPLGIDQLADIGDGPQQVIFELRCPAADEAIGHRDAKPRHDIGNAARHRPFRARAD